MNILAIHTSHDGSMTYVKENKIVFHTQLDRYNRMKHMACPSYKALKIIEGIEFDKFIITELGNDSAKEWLAMMDNNKIIREKLAKAERITYNEHHLLHAYASLCWHKDIPNIVVMDGNGVIKNNKHLCLTTEQESIYSYGVHIKSSHNNIGYNYELDCREIFKEKFQEGKLLALSLHDKKANKIQKRFEREFDKYIHSNNLKDSVIFTGGCTQNVVNNSLQLKNFKTIFPDPFNGDFGISLGAINYYLNNRLRVDNVYLGVKQKLNFNLFKDCELRDTSPQEVASILINEPVAIFQSRSEQGQRGLGNRSLLMNANHMVAMEKVNAIKEREWYRPFACTIIQTEAAAWFDMTVKESPYMMFTFKVLEDKKHYFKTGLAKDDTCRLQTLKYDDNPHFYNLLEAFEDRSELPFLLNTSLNLPGEVLVEDMTDLREMLDNSNLKYVYFPEEMMLLIKPSE